MKLDNGQMLIVALRLIKKIRKSEIQSVCKSSESKRNRNSLVLKLKRLEIELINIFTDHLA